jgi:hypothetical protein
MAMEMLGLLPWQALQSWLHTASDHAYVAPLNCDDADNINNNNKNNNNNNNNARYTMMVMVIVQQLWW